MKYRKLIYDEIYFYSLSNQSISLLINNKNLNIVINQIR